MSSKRFWVLYQCYITTNERGVYADELKASGRISRSWLYEALQDLCRRRYLTCSIESLARAREGRRPPRRYYRITSEGRRALLNA